ncbi:tRNA (adenosine(37)-N6)-dimethylallyltransferase MiaA [Roseimarinus sediminis]|uniref:tRNA (adenosine(37)-N6)-dimethylallyltransferase MiaA n=1 Tax=Roseimarinus sediminis TaxID=1610899 RepID=UPI003D241B89
MSKYNMVTLLGATASGKTSVAAHLAVKIDGEIISADSRQVYRGMNIGTGKDLADYTVDGRPVSYHLIDLVDAGYQYNVFEYQRDFISVFEDIQKRGKLPVLCGGSGMYIDAVLKGYKLINVPVNQELRTQLEKKDLNELSELLKNYKALHNRSDIDTRKRAIRAIEIEAYYANNPEINTWFPEINSLIVGIKFDREARRRRISQRLKARLDEGMADEVKQLLEQGLSPEQLLYYGLEYKYITQYLLGELDYQQMFSQLETAIHQFSKRQMTWFRRMEKQGFEIHWLDGHSPMDEKLKRIENWLE